ncbi:MAG: 3-hydroxyacyl-CoA dehydrogenase, partial [Gammaproteobacteria bacterium]|nr:3-hydroxyacyl-CoA dehydrogenase [Gammaproteobacteria bacterium]
LAGAFGRRVPQVLVDLVAAGKFGRKSGQGFYTWTAGKALRNPGPVPRTPEDLEDRLILPMVNEAVAVLREGIVDDADLIDGAAIFGTGFAPFRGGPIAYARARGTEAVRARLEELALRHGERFRPDAGWDGTAL